MINYFLLFIYLLFQQRKTNRQKAQTRGRLPGKEERLVVSIKVPTVRNAEKQNYT